MCYKDYGHFSKAFFLAPAKFASSFLHLQNELSVQTGVYAALTCWTAGVKIQMHILKRQIALTKGRLPFWKSWSKFICFFSHPLLIHSPLATSAVPGSKVRLSRWAAQKRSEKRILIAATPVQTHSTGIFRKTLGTYTHCHQVYGPAAT